MSATPMDHNTAPLITREGYEHLRAEIAKLCDARPEMIERLRGARDNGNLDDNPTLYEVLEEQAQLEQRIAQLEGSAGRGEGGSAQRRRDRRHRKLRPAP